MSMTEPVLPSAPSAGPHWPLPPQLPQPPKRTEPVHIPTVFRAPHEDCPQPDEHYACETVEGLDAAVWEGMLRGRFTVGYRLVQVVRGDAATFLLLYEHSHH
jgi:hypothetical protein